MDEIPELGQDTDEILTKLGYTPQQIEQFRLDGVV
jgi:crotonobetainyl-CoA:carnitine CoA-transferase CaiB-like acyl-CoA transferase